MSLPRIVGKIELSGSLDWKVWTSRSIFCVARAHSAVIYLWPLMRLRRNKRRFLRPLLLLLLPLLVVAPPTLKVSHLSRDLHKETLRKEVKPLQHVFVIGEVRATNITMYTTAQKARMRAQHACGHHQYV